MRKSDKVILFVIAMAIIAGMVAIANAATITLEWDPNTPDVDGYNIYQRLVGDNETQFDYSAPLNSDAIVTGTTFEVTDLVEDQAYSFVVRAAKNGDRSADSNEIVYMVPIVQPPIILPGQVSDIQWDYDTSTLSWAWAADGTPDEYIIGLVNSKGHDDSITTSKNTRTFDNLVPGETYTIVIKVRIGNNIGPSSRAIQFTMPIKQTIRIYPKQIINLRIESMEASGN